MKHLSIHNNSTIALKDIPRHDYYDFRLQNLEMLHNFPFHHCVNYFGYEQDGQIHLFCCIAEDKSHKINISGTVIDNKTILPSLTAQNHNFENFERELHENFGIDYTDHPWLKPLRKIDNYSFLKGEGEELHEVGVGPIHAGIIEPGHFRFICNGEQIMHLEIQLGFQHRGIEKLLLKKHTPDSLATIVENIAGDSVAGHTTAFANLWESLCSYPIEQYLSFSRTLAGELERIAVHTGDMAAICGDIGYQLGNSVYGRLRTPIVNFLQEWGGNRLGKGIIRPGKINYPFNKELAERLTEILTLYEKDFDEITAKLFKLPSALSRMEKTGALSYDDVLQIGTVGPSARMSNLERDIRISHPYNLYRKEIKHIPVLKRHGDVYSRVQIRKEEVRQSIAYIRSIIADIPDFHEYTKPILTPASDSFTISLSEGWRGEICHCAITDHKGNLLIYKIKDPSFHNWKALAMAVRNNEISDFPVCNKSFNLSYCGHDL